MLKEKFDFFDTNNKWYKYLFFVFAAIALVVMISSSSHYGICWDEQLQKDYGEKCLKFYTSGGKDTSFIIPNKNVHLYGGFVEITAAIFTKNYKGDVFDRRHLYFSLFGFFAILICGLLARELAGWRAGLIAFLFLFFSPLFFGHSMFNSKDVPFAAAYLLSVFAMVRLIKEFPKISWINAMGLIAGTGGCIGIRVGGFLLIGYFFLFVALRLGYELYMKRSNVLELFVRYKKYMLMTIVLAIACYGFGLLFWPYVILDPIHHPIEAFREMSHYKFNSYNLFEGNWIYSEQAPWYYIPKWIWITIPLFINIGVFLIPALVAFKLSMGVRVNIKLYALVFLHSCFHLLLSF
jgi:hypothetical protein